MPSISPSRFTAMRLCPAKEIWAASRNAALLPVSPAARLGSAIHRLLEDAGKGRLISNDPAAVDSRLNELIAAAEATMRMSSLERHLVPLRDTVPSFEVRSIQATARASEILDALHHIHSFPASNQSEQGPDQYGLEFPVSSADGRVRGVIDAVIPRPEGPVIRDYKSGAIFDHTVGIPPVVKEAYQDQLKLYAALYHDSVGMWPAHLEIVPLAGQAIEVPFEPAQSTALFGDATALRSRVNARIAEDGDIGSDLASPSAEACQFCPYRPGCRAYLDLITRSASVDWSQDVVGHLEGVESLGNGKLMVRISTGDRHSRIHGLSPEVSRHQWLSQIRTGEEIGAFSVRGNPRGDSFEETPFTTIYPLPTLADAA